MEIIRLNKKDRTKLTRQMFKYLKSCHHSALGYFFPKKKSKQDVFTDLDQVFSFLSESKKEAISTTYSTGDIRFIIMDVLIGVAIQSPHIETDTPKWNEKPLSAIMTDEEITKLAEDILLTIVQPPRAILSIPLRRISLESGEGIEITSDCWIAKRDKGDGYRMFVSDNGYMPRNLTGLTSTFDRLLTKVKASTGLMCAFDLLKILGIPGKPPDDIVSDIGSLSCPIFEENNKGEISKVRDYPISFNLTNILSSLVFTKYAKEEPDPKYDFQKYKDFSEIEHIGNKLRPIGNVLSSEDEDAARIKTAAYWYLEGLCSDNQSVRFIQSTIAVEALVGRPEGRGGIKERLSDRVAFLLGKNQAGRKSLKHEFANIYKIRSQIVHSTKAQLSIDDQKKLERLEEILKELIRKEIDNYSKSV